MLKQNKRKYFIVAFMLFSVFTFLFSNVPNLIDYQGRLTDENGDPLTGTFSITFSIYNVEIGGTAIWDDTLPVYVNEGLFHVTLGEFDDDYFNSENRWLGLTIESDDEMEPRTKILSVPYSLQSGNSYSLEGVTLSGLVQQDGGENVNISGTMTAGSFVGNGSGLTNIPGDDLGNHTATTNLNMSNQRINNLNDPSSGSDAATKNYVDSQPGDNLGNHTATTNLNMDGNRVENLGNPNSGDDAATKQYVDENDDVGGDDDLGNHTATQNIKLNGHWLSGDGGNEGVYVASDGYVIMNYKLNVQDDVDLNGYCHVNGDIHAGSGSITGSFTALTLNAGNAGFIRTGEPTSSYGAQDIASTEDIFADDDIIAGDDITANGTIKTGSPSSSYGSSDIASTDDIYADDDIIADDKVQANWFYVSDCGSNNAVTVHNDSGSYPTIWAENYGTGTALYGKNYGSGWTGYLRSNSSTGNGLYVYGDLYSTGSNGRMLEIGNEEHAKTIFPLSTKSEIQTSGSGRLANGERLIEFSDIFIKSKSDNLAYKVIVTPTEMCNGICVLQKSKDHFVVKELMNGKSNASFDWVVYAIVKGGEERNIKIVNESDLPKSMEPEEDHESLSTD